MRGLKIVGAAVLLLSIIGCSTSGGTIGGLFPAPKFTKGEIENNVYISMGSDFSVSIPHKNGTYEYTYMEIKEQYNEYGAYISFGPAALDKSIYRLEIGKKLSPESKNVVFENAVDAIFTNYSQQLKAGYKSKPELIRKEKLEINGVESYIIQLEQQVNNQRLSHEVIISNYEGMAAIFWVQTEVARGTKASVNALQFAQSFKVLN